MIGAWHPSAERSTSAPIQTTAWDAVRDFANVHDRVAAGFVDSNSSRRW